MRKHVLLFLLLSVVAQGGSLAQIADPGFEKPAQGFGTFAYRPTGSAWTFTTNAGLSASGSGFSRNNPVAPEGNQVAFIQATGTVSQTVKVPAAGTYMLTVQAAQRNYPQPFGVQKVAVAIDGQVAQTITPSGITYQ